MSETAFAVVEFIFIVVVIVGTIMENNHMGPFR